MLPNPLQRVAGCATVVTGPSFSLGRTVACIGVRHAVPSLADHPAAQPPERGSVDALISQTRRLRGEVDAVRRDAPDRRHGPAGPLAARPVRPRHASTRRPRRALGAAEGRPAAPCPSSHEATPAAYRAVPAAPRHGSLLSRVGSAEWNLLTDEASWSGELYRDPRPRPRRGPADPRRTALRGVRRGPADADGDGHGLPRRRQADRRRVPHRPARRRRPDRAHDGRARARHRRQHRLACGRCCGTSASCAAASGPSARPATPCSTNGTSRRPSAGSRSSCRRPCCRRGAVPCGSRAEGPETLDLAAPYLPSSTSALIGGDWYDALELPDGGHAVERRRPHRPRRDRHLGHGDDARRPARHGRGGHRARTADGAGSTSCSTPPSSPPWAARCAAATGPTPAPSPGRRPDTPPRCCSATGRGACSRPAGGRPARRHLRRRVRAGRRARSSRATCCSCTPTDWYRATQPAAGADSEGTEPTPRPGPPVRRGPRRAGLRTDGRRGVRRDASARTTPAC